MCIIHSDPLKHLLSLKLLQYRHLDLDSFVAPMLPSACVPGFGILYEHVLDLDGSSVFDVKLCHGFVG